MWILLQLTVVAAVILRLFTWVLRFMWYCLIWLITLPLRPFKFIFRR